MTTHRIPESSALGRAELKPGGLAVPSRTRSTPTGTEPSQRDQLLRLLIDNPSGLCTAQLLRHLSHRFSVPLAKLRSEGYIISKHRCWLPFHSHTAAMWVYRLDGLPDWQEGDPCPACRSVLSHVSWCPARHYEPGQLMLGGV